MAIKHKRTNTASYAWQSGDLDDGQLGINTNDGTLHLKDSGGTVQKVGDKNFALLSGIGLPVELVIAIGDEDTAAETGTSLVTFRMPFAMTLNTGSNGVRGSCTTAPTGSTAILDVNEGGTSILSTKLTIDASETTSTTAATPVVISDVNLADDAEITIDLDQVGMTVAGAGYKVMLRGVRA